LVDNEIQNKVEVCFNKWCWFSSRFPGGPEKRPKTTFILQKLRKELVKYSYQRALAKLTLVQASVVPISNSRR